MINIFSLESLELVKNIVAIILAYLMIAGIAGAFQAWVAYKSGDDTAEQFGMMTINPFAHVDPTTLWLMPLGYAIFRVVIGLSRPVPIVWHSISEPLRKLKMTFVALAQPLAILGILVGMLVLQNITMVCLGIFKAIAVLPTEMRVYGYIMQALVGFSVWFIPYQLLMSFAQLYIYAQEKKGQSVNYMIVLMMVPLFGAVLLMDVSQWLLVHFLSYIELGMAGIVSLIITKAGM